MGRRRCIRLFSFKLKSVFNWFTSLSLFFFLLDILKYYFQDQMIKQNSRQTLKYNVRHQTAALVFLVKWV